MDTNLIKLKKLILASSLSKEDKEKFLTLFSKAKDKDLKGVVDLFKEDPEQIKIISNVYQAKIEALINRDQKAWNEILQHEYKSLEVIESNSKEV